MESFAQLEGVRLYYLEVGAGQPVLFIPGWCYGAGIFERNLPVIGRHYRAIAYDPRSHGRSEITKRGNGYGQFGRDLHTLIQELQLHNVTLIGWSLGVTTAYSYFDQFGTDNIAAFVGVDEAPKIISSAEGDWGEGPQAEICSLIEMLTTEGHQQFFTDYLRQCYEGEPDPEWSKRMSTAAARTPASVAALLLADAALRDYSETARQVASNIPMMQIIRKDWAPQASRWIEQNLPGARLEILGGHLMVHEYAGQFNSLLLDFLQSNGAGAHAP